MITIETLRLAGLTDQQIVKVLELDQKERLAARREQNRINKRNQRSRQHVSADRADIDDTPPPPIIPPAPQKIPLSKSAALVCHRIGSHRMLIGPMRGRRAYRKPISSGRREASATIGAPSQARTGSSSIGRPLGGTASGVSLDADRTG